ncbi:disease resistance protein (CC-NBS-LRR class) family protein, partial [Trifolium medium]|nr:disease resistance protein (CC-NBS-LRR class) family protein [Trifolium medium]
MKVLECINFKVVSSTAATFVPSLERLKLSGCEKFRGWMNIQDEE